jgi:hypothetical protein
MIADGLPHPGSQRTSSGCLRSPRPCWTADAREAPGVDGSHDTAILCRQPSRELRTLRPEHTGRSLIGLDVVGLATYYLGPTVQGGSPNRGGRCTAGSRSLSWAAFDPGARVRLGLHHGNCPLNRRSRKVAARARHGLVSLPLMGSRQGHASLATAPSGATRRMHVVTWRTSQEGRLIAIWQTSTSATSAGDRSV